MKKFFTVIPSYMTGSHIYAPIGNEKLRYDKKINFPILSAIHGYAEAGEEITVIEVVIQNKDTNRNQGVFREQLRELCEEKGCTAKVKTVNVPKDDRVSVHVATFQKLIDLVEDEDEIFACLTYGTKPLSEVLKMAVQYAYRVKYNTSVTCIVYGEVDRSAGSDKAKWKTNIYDETALLQLDEIVRMLAERGVSEPESMMRSIISLYFG